MKICKICSIDIPHRRSEICKKCYYKEYHLKTFKKKISACVVCNEKSELGHKKYCLKCSSQIPSTCRDCGKTFAYKAKYQRCTRCQYYWYKTNTPEKFQKSREKTNKKINTRKRVLKGLPLDHVFFNGPRKEGYLNKKGYRLFLKKDVISGKNRRVYEHVLVMEEHLNRRLAKGETVHHKNGVRDDNRIENLELWNKGQPAGQRVEDRIKYYIDFLKFYGYTIIKE